MLLEELIRTTPNNFYSVQFSKFLKSNAVCLSTNTKSIPPLKKPYRFGGAREDRTPDLLRARQALSQLSYGPFLLVFFALDCVALITRSVTYQCTLSPSFQRMPCLKQKILRKKLLLARTAFAPQRAKASFVESKAKFGKVYNP